VRTSTIDPLACVATGKLGSVRYNSSLGPVNYFPYGEGRTNTADGVEKFGTHTRDAVGQDYAEQRYYNSSMGAFWSPDRGGIKTADPNNPSSWNRYAYTMGDPIGSFHPHGREDCDPDECCSCDDPWDLCSEAAGAQPADSCIVPGPGPAPAPPGTGPQCPLVALTGNFIVKPGVVAMFAPDMAPAPLKLRRRSKPSCS